MNMRMGAEDAIRAKALGVALDVPDEKEALILELRRSLDAMWCERDSWHIKALQMRDACEEWRRRWVFAFGALLIMIACGVWAALGAWWGLRW